MAKKAKFIPKPNGKYWFASDTFTPTKAYMQGLQGAIRLRVGNVFKTRSLCRVKAEQAKKLFSK